MPGTQNVINKFNYYAQCIVNAYCLSVRDSGEMPMSKISNNL